MCRLSCVMARAMSLVCPALAVLAASPSQAESVTQRPSGVAGFLCHGLLPDLELPGMLLCDEGSVPKVCAESYTPIP